MRISENVTLKGFKKIKLNKKIKNYLKKIIHEENHIIGSCYPSYKNSYNKKTILKLKRYNKINLIGMGGSILGARSIYSFLNHKIKKNFCFFDNLNIKKNNTQNKNKNLNLIISKSGNTLETITNMNILIKKNQKNIFITQNKESYLTTLAKKMRAEIIHHNDYIGGRYSVLSEVGMLPAELMGLNQKKFRCLNNLINNKNFVNSLISNVSNTLEFIRNKKFNSIILNYDENSNDLFYWYQQLLAESLGKKGKGLTPIISNMPKDNHSLMQLYLDGKKNNFFTFFFTNEKSSKKILNNNLFNSHHYLKNKKVEDILKAQFISTQNVFKKKKIPFRSFYINKKDEQSLGVLFTFFILETILLAKVMDVNPYDQPAVELIKKETKKILVNS